MSYRKNLDANRDALFGPPAGGGGNKGGNSRPKSTTTTTADRNDLFAGSSKPTNSPNNNNKPTAPTVPTNQGYQPVRKSNNNNKSKITARSALSGEAKMAKIKEAEDYKQKANQAMQRSFFSKPDPVAASTYYKRAADAYQLVGDIKLERLYRLESAQCNKMSGAWASTASDYTRAADLTFEDSESFTDLQTQRQAACSAHLEAALAWTEMGEKAKAAASRVQAAMALNYGDDSTLLGKDTLKALEEAVEAHVPDVFNPYARYRQTGVSAFVDPNNNNSSDDNKPSPETLALAQEHLVTRAYAHEPLQELVDFFVQHGEYASALYAAGAATVLLEKDGVSTLSLSKAYVTETILTLAMGDPIAADQAFLQRHVQKTAYLTSRECKLAEDLIRAVKTRDLEALETARDFVTGSNKAALANLNSASLRELVSMIRLSGVARKSNKNEINISNKQNSSDKNASSSPPPVVKQEAPLEDVLKKKTGYEADVAHGADFDTDALQNELDGLDFDGLDSDDDAAANGDDSDDDDDDVDLR